MVMMAMGSLRPEIEEKLKPLILKSWRHNKEVDI
jgi:hypothetical protein